MLRSVSRLYAPKYSSRIHNSERVILTLLLFLFATSKFSVTAVNMLRVPNARANWRESFCLKLVSIPSTPRIRSATDCDVRCRWNVGYYSTLNISPALVRYTYHLVLQHALIIITVPNPRQRHLNAEGKDHLSPHTRHEVCISQRDRARSLYPPRSAP